MAVYQIFASADATIYSRYPVKNTGRDEVLEVSVKNSQDGVAFYNKQQLLTQNPYYTYDLAANDNYSTTDQLFPESDNSKNWGKSNYILYLLSNIIKTIFKLFKLDIQLEPGYSFFYIFSKIILFIILFLIFFIIYKI